MENQTRSEIKMFPVSKTLYEIAENISFANLTIEDEVKVGDEILPPDVVSRFLNEPTTKVYVVKGEHSEDDKLVAFNFATQEVIEISNLGNHISGLNFVLLGAINKFNELKTNPQAEILSKDFICELHKTLFKARVGEPGFGEFRNYRIVAGKNGWVQRPADVAMNDKPGPNGERRLNPYWQPPRGGDNNVEKHIDRLVEWVNGTEPYRVKDEMYSFLKQGDGERWIEFPPFEKLSPLERAVRFHVEFVRIQPFMDGNRRAGRMLMEYLLSIQGLPLVNIHRQEKQAYMSALNIAISTGNFEPMIKLVEESQIENSAELYSITMDFYGRDHSKHSQNITRKGKTNKKKDVPPDPPSGPTN